MQVRLVTPHLLGDDPLSARVIAQWQFFRQRGDDVQLESAQAPAGVAAEVAAATSLDATTRTAPSDLAVFHAVQPYPLLERLQAIERGVVVLYLHQADPPQASTARAAFIRLAACADLVVVEGDALAQLLVDEDGFAATPVRTLQVGAGAPPAEYAVRWAEVVAEATAWLPNRPYPYGHLPALEELHPPHAERSAPAKTAADNDWLENAALDADLQQLAADAKTMQRDYVVRSRLPLVGPVLAWLRRNLTSHLREPYIDPTFQRQERFNQQLVRTIAALAQEQAELTQQIRMLGEELARARRNSATSVEDEAPAGRVSPPPEELDA